MRVRAIVLAGVVLAGAGATAFAQDEVVVREREVARSGEGDRSIVGSARRLLAEGRAEAAEKLLNPFLEEHEGTDHPDLAEAYLLRGDARTATGREFKALYDYERVVKGHPESDSFVPALERELATAIRYLNGLRKRAFGFRIDDGTPLAEEIILRINERLPGSRLAERAVLELAGYYYRTRDLRSAATTYDVFLRIFPTSDRRQEAMQRRIYANIAQFKGPAYDASGLIDATYQIDAYRQEFPAEAARDGLSDALVTRLDESAAAQALGVARWYLKRGDPVSAKVHLVRLVRRHPLTAAAQEALRIIGARGWAGDGAEVGGEASRAADSPPAGDVQAPGVPTPSGDVSASGSAPLVPNPSPPGPTTPSGVPGAMPSGVPR